MTAVQQSTKAQVQLAETIAVVVVFSILLIFGLYWMGTSQTEQVSQQRVELENLEMLEMTKAIMSLPEIQCSIAGRPDTSCVDLVRVQTLKKEIDDNQTIKELYQDRYRTNTRGSYAAEVIDVTTETPTRYELFNFTENTPTASRQQQAIPVVLRDPVTQRTNFSMLLLTQEVIP